MEWDEAQHFPSELVPKLGLMGIQFPEDYGGAGMSAIDYCICIEELARVDPGVALSVAAHNGLCSAHIFLFGSEAQKQRYPGAARPGRGDRRLGTDRVDVRQRCRRHATAPPETRDGWVLNGSRALPHGRVGDVVVVMAVTDRAAGPKGISAFILERGTPGMAAGSRRRTNSACARATLARCVRRVPSPRRPTARGRKAPGFVNTLQVLDAGRIGIAALAGRVGCRAPTRLAALRYAQERRRSPARRIADFQAINGSWPTTPRAARRPPADLPRGVPEGSQQTDDARVGDGEGCSPAKSPCGAADRLRADLRRLRLHQGLPRREVLSRREALHDRRRNERDSAACHRPTAAVMS